MEKLEKRLDTFFEKHTIDQITKEEIKKEFSNLEEKTSEDYSLLHAITDKLYPIEKAVKAISILLELGCNPNNQNIYGKYSFIHLAFYSNYSLTFFQKIIPIAKKYDFNINCQDEDGDTLLHSAIYSEDYLDKIFPLFEIVEPNFDFEIKNKEEKNLIDALNDSIQESDKTNNKKWNQQLTAEKEKITNYLTEKYRQLELKREEQKRKEQEEKERKKYQKFLENFKQKLQSHSTMSDINELLELTNNIKEEDYKTKVTEKLKQLQIENKKLITEGKIKINQLTTLSEFFPDSEILKEELENIKELEDLNRAPLTTIKKEISSINIVLDKQLDFAIEHTAKIINDAYQNLEQVQKLTTKPLIKKVKTLIKTPSDEKRKV